MKKLLILLAVTFLAACTTPAAQTPLGKFTLADAQTASSMATQAGDAPAATCYNYIIKQIQSTSATGTCGLLCANEFKRTATTTETNLGTACGGVLPLVLGL